MTNETELHANGAADEVANIAAITAETSSPTETAAAEPEVPAEPKPPSFDDLGLHPDVKLALDDMGYFAPTPVQTAAFKPISENKDLLVQAKTGTGKTTAFGLPLINRLIPTHRQPQALILAPTRELALQVARELTNIGKHRGIIIEAIYGGAPIGKQITNLRNGVHIVVGTPGRVLDHIGRRTLDTRTISTFVLDECDEMLSMGFLEDIQRVVSHLPEKKQTLLFSATMPDEVKRYSRQHMVAPEQLSLSRDSISVTDIHHAYYIVSGIARSRDLLKVIYAENPDSAIIFCNMRDETTMVAKFLMKQGLDAEPLSSDLSQSDRERVMGRMKQKNLRFLVATDVAARGIDISDLSHVINFSVPESPEVYVHRTGRTGRAGKKGTALSLVGPRELGSFRYVRLQFGIKPEERVLPKDDIFVGKLKVPLPPIGTPQPPDPVQILIRGVPATPTDLETKIFEKLLASSSGRRVLAALVADKLDKLSTRSKPKRERAAREEGTEAAHADGGEAHGDRPERSDRGDRPERGGFGDRDRGARFDRDRGGERGERPRWRDRDDRSGGGERGPRERFDHSRGGGAEAGAEGAIAPAEPRKYDRDRGEGRGDRDGGGEPRRFDRDRGERGDRDRGGRFDRDRDRGDRGGRFDRDRGAPPAGDAAAAPAAEGAAPAATEGGEPRRFDRDRDRDRGGRDRDRGDRGDRGGRFDRDRDRGGERRFDRDRDRDRNREAPAAAVTGEDAPVVIAEPIESAAGTPATDATVETRPVETRDRDRDRDRDRGGRDRDRGGRDRDRGGRDRDRDRGDRHEARPAAASEAPVTEVGTEAAPVVETTEAPSKVDDVARAVLDRKSKRDAKRTAPTEETREFWETWAEEKTTREPAPAAAADAETSEASSNEDGDGESRPSRSKSGSRSSTRGGRDKDRGRGDKRTKSDTKLDKPRAAASEKADEKADEGRGSRTKRDTVATPAPAMEGAQARLFVSLGKKHGVSADDLRDLLAGAIGGDKARIGSVSLRDSHAHVRVPEDLAEKIIKGVSGTQHNDHDVTVERARA